MMADRPIRVFHLIKSLGRGGAEVLLVDGLRSRDRARFDYGYGYFLPWKDALVEDLTSLGADVHCFGGVDVPRILARTPAVVRHLRQWRADVVHCHLPIAGVVGRAAGRVAGIPVVYTEHNLMQRYHPITRAANVATWSLQDQVIAVSGDVAASARRHTRARVPIEIVSNGVSCDAFAPNGSGRALRQQLSIADDAPIIGTVAVFRSQKCLDLWLEMAARIIAADPRVQCLLVGDGPLRHELEARAAALGIAQHVHFPGLQPEVRPYLDAMDVYVMSSEFEGMPVALLEAMAMELPVVATSVGGIPEVISSAEVGVLVPAHDVDALVAATSQLLADENQRRAIGASARQRIQDKFAISAMTRILEDLYVAVIERRPSHD